MRKTAAGRPSSPSDQGAASFRMAPKHHSTPLSGGDRKALKNELGKARAMTGILAACVTAASPSMMASPGMSRASNHGKTLGPVQPIAREDLLSSPVKMDLKAIAVVLDLVKPLVALRSTPPQLCRPGTSLIGISSIAAIPSSRRYGSRFSTPAYVPSSETCQHAVHK